MKERKPWTEAAVVGDRVLPELPAWKAFVVQFNRQTQAQGTTFAGRIEHLSSGRRARFESSEDLVAALEKLLAEVGLNAPSNEHED